MLARSPSVLFEGVAHLERVRCEVRLRRGFDAQTFEAAFESFRRLYNVAPDGALCSADVLLRFSALYTTGGEGWVGDALRHRGIPLRAAVLPEGVLALEGEVDEDRMGDW